MSPDPFITAQDLTDFLGRNVTSDAGAVMAIDAACDMVRTFAEQSFNRAVSTVALDGTGTDTLLLRESPVNSAGTVTVNGGTITDYVLGSNGVLYRGTAGSDPRPVWPSGRQNIGVVYDHGYTDGEVPRDVRMVALSIAARLVVQGPASEEQIGDVRIKYAASSTDLTNGEQIILRKYRPAR